MSRLTRKEKRKYIQDGIIDRDNSLKGLKIENFDMLTKTQEESKEAWDEGYDTILYGSSGTGKTFLALYFALKDVMSKESEREKVIIFRSTVPSREQGFLKGTAREKEEEYLQAYPPLINKIFNNGSAADILRKLNKVEYRSTSYNRGLEFNNAVLIADEIQNMVYQELDTLYTRTGENSRWIMCGDIKQNDLTQLKGNQVSGFEQFLRISREMDEFDDIEFTVDDIVRSGKVKSYLLAKERLGY